MGKYPADYGVFGLKDDNSIYHHWLSAYARKNKAKRTLWEYDNIIRSLYFLNYVDLLSLRRYVQQAVNDVNT